MQTFFRAPWAIITSIQVANWYAVALGVGTIFIIRLLKRYIPKAPGALIALILILTALPDGRGYVAVTASHQSVTLPGLDNVWLYALGYLHAIIVPVNLHGVNLQGENFRNRRRRGNWRRRRRSGWSAQSICCAARRSGG